MDDKILDIVKIIELKKIALLTTLEKRRSKTTIDDISNEGFELLMSEYQNIQDRLLTLITK